MTLTSMEVVQATGASYRQLDYWTRKGLVTPLRSETQHVVPRSVADPSKPGSGRVRIWDDSEGRRDRRHGRTHQMGPHTDRAIRWAFGILDAAAILAIVAPLRGWNSDFVVLGLLIGIVVVQTTTAQYWRVKIPEQFESAAGKEGA